MMPILSGSMVIIDGKNIIRFVSMNAAKLFGYAENDLVGQPLTKLIPTRFREADLKAIAAYASQLDDKSILELTNRQRLRKDGTEFPCNIAMSLCPIDGKAYYVCMLSDILVNFIDKPIVGDIPHVRYEKDFQNAFKELVEVVFKLREMVEGNSNANRP